MGNGHGERYRTGGDEGVPGSTAGVCSKRRGRSTAEKGRDARGGDEGGKERQRRTLHAQPAGRRGGRTWVREVRISRGGGLGDVRVIGLEVF
jgi:hypothetical protein